MNGKFGVHSLVFTDDWSESNARAACDAAARIGYDLIEVLIFDHETFDPEMTGRVVADSGLDLRLGMALGPDADISSTDPDLAARGEAAVARGLELASALGAPAISGITYAAFNAYDAPPTMEQRDQVAASIARLDARAGELGVKLGLEPVNRYESYLVNTLDQAGDMIRAIGAKNLFVHMDTFHMNIEEADLAGAIARNGNLLGYAHLADNNRGVLGAGTFDFTSYFRALARAGYTGDFTVESFSAATLSQDIVGAVSLWRRPWEDPVLAAKAALDFMKTGVAAATASEVVW